MDCRLHLHQHCFHCIRLLALLGFSGPDSAKVVSEAAPTAVEQGHECAVLVLRQHRHRRDTQSLCKPYVLDGTSACRSSSSNTPWRWPLHWRCHLNRSRRGLCCNHYAIHHRHPLPHPKISLRTSRQLRFMDLEAQAPLLAHCVETLTGVTTIRAFGWQRDSHRRCLGLLDRSQRP